MKKALSTGQPSDPMHQNYLFPTAFAISFMLKLIAGIGPTGGHSTTRSISTHECLFQKISSSERLKSCAKDFKRRLLSTLTI
jgi:hypothetical protein